METVDPDYDAASDPTPWAHEEERGDDDDEESSGGDVESSSESDRGEDELDSEAVEAGLDRIMQDLQDSTVEDPEAFLSRNNYLAIVSFSHPRVQNILHRIASRPRLSDHKSLIHHLLRHHDYLMQTRDNAGHQPLLIATDKGNMNFISHVLSSEFSGRKQMSEVIGNADSSGKNCIHLAIERRLVSDLTMRLIKIAEPSALAAQDRDGCTPLHIAVRYERCCEGQDQVVLALLKYGDAALDKKCKSPPDASPYVLHCETKKQADAAKVRSARRLASTSTRDAEDSPSIKHVPPHLDAHERRGKSETAPGGRSLGPMSDSMPGRKRLQIDVDMTPKKEVSEERASDADFPTPDFPKPGPRIANTSRVRTNGLSAAGDTRPPPETEPSAVESSRSSRPPKSTKVSKSKGKSRTSTPEPNEQTAEKIAKELKLHYMRSIFRYAGEPENYTDSHADSHADMPSRQRTQATAMQFLYGNNIPENTHICFGSLEGPPEIDEKRFLATYDSFKFDSVLQYVGFRRAVFTKPQLPPRANQATSGRNSGAVSRGRKDMEIFFDWLRRKGVKNIVKVLIYDEDDPPHSDESIERALGKFEIEILDWRKIDLCPDTIVKACPNLRRLHLSWSGSNAVLRGWSEPDGLVRLRMLEYIQIREVDNLEAETRTLANMKRFKERIHTQRNIQNTHLGDPYPSIEIPDRSKLSRNNGQSLPRGNGTANAAVRKMTHNWLEVMDRFAEGVYKLTQDSHNENPDFFSTLAPDLKKDVLVALIDDGVHIGDPSLEGKIVSGMCFDDGNDIPDLPGANRPYHESETGHGTLMARLICRVCPNAKIYACRLNVYSGQTPHFTARSAAEAVEHCVERGYEIISLSWTIKKSDPDALEGSNESGIDRLESALKSAAEKNILVFCASPDEGSMTDTTFEGYYPVGCKQVTHNIFKIGAATVNNRGLPQGAKKSQLDFLLPGHEVSMGGDGSSFKTGSSIATALAAGMAALVIHCVQLAAIRPKLMEYSRARGRNKPPVADTDKGDVDSDDDKDVVTTPVSSLVITSEQLRQVKKFEFMKRIFLGLAREKGRITQSEKYLDVDRWFAEPAHHLLRYSNSPRTVEKRLGVIEHLASDFWHEAKK